MPQHTVTFSAPLWIYQGKGAWYFITLPVDESERILFLTAHRRRGWGSVRVSVAIGNTQWQTSIFPDKKAGAFLLPVKAEVRKKEGLSAGDDVRVTLDIEA